MASSGESSGDEQQMEDEQEAEENRDMEVEQEVVVDHEHELEEEMEIEQVVRDRDQARVDSEMQELAENVISEPVVMNDPEMMDEQAPSRSRRTRSTRRNAPYPPTLNRSPECVETSVPGYQCRICKRQVLMIKGRNGIRSQEMNAMERLLHLVTLVANKIKSRDDARSLYKMSHKHDCKSSKIPLHNLYCVCGHHFPDISKDLLKMLKVTNPDDIENAKAKVLETVVDRANYIRKDIGRPITADSLIENCKQFVCGSMPGPSNSENVGEGSSEYEEAKPSKRYEGSSRGKEEEMPVEGDEQVDIEVTSQCSEDAADLDISQSSAPSEPSQNLGYVQSTSRGRRVFIGDRRVFHRYSEAAEEAVLTTTAIAGEYYSEGDEDRYEDSAQSSQCSDDSDDFNVSQIGEETDTEDEVEDDDHITRTYERQESEELPPLSSSQPSKFPSTSSHSAEKLDRKKRSKMCKICDESRKTNDLSSVWSKGIVLHTALRDGLITKKQCTQIHNSSKRLVSCIEHCQAAVDRLFDTFGTDNLVQFRSVYNRRKSIVDKLKREMEQIHQVPHSSTSDFIKEARQFILRRNQGSIVNTPPSSSAAPRGPRRNPDGRFANLTHFSPRPTSRHRDPTPEKKEAMRKCQICEEDRPALQVREISSYFDRFLIGANLHHSQGATLEKAKDVLHKKKRLTTCRDHVITARNDIRTFFEIENHEDILEAGNHPATGIYRDLYRSIYADGPNVTEDEFLHMIQSFLRRNWNEE